MEMSELDEYIVPSYDLWCGEYVYAINGLEPAKHDDFYKIISALLNTSGGIIQITHVAPERKPYDQWQNNLKAKLLDFMSSDVYHECIHLYVEGTCAYIVVFKSKVFITWKSHMYTRGCGAETTQVKYFHDIALIVNQRVKDDPQKFDQFHLDIEDRYEEACLHPESKNLEFKCFGEDDNSDAIIEKLNYRRNVLFAFGNVEGGGEMIVGIKDEQASPCIVQGQIMPQYEEETFVHKLQEKLPQSETMNWSCHFIRVRKSSQNQKRKVLICIRVYQCPGGTFRRDPESFIVCDDGRIVKLPVEEWRLKHHTGKTSSETAPESSQSEDGQQLHEEMCVLTTTQTMAWPATRRVYEGGMQIRFSHHSSLFNRSNAQHRAHHISYIQANTMFRMDNPVHLTPAREDLGVLSNEVFRVIDDSQTKRGTQAFGIAHESLLSCFADQYIPGIDQLTAANRVMDLLVVNSMAEICLFVVCRRLRNIMALKLYTWTLARLIKKKVLECLHHLVVDYKSIKVRCELLDVCGQPHDMRTDKMYRSYDTWFPDPVSIPDTCLEFICSALSIVLNKTHFHDEIQRGSSDALAQEQINICLSLESRFNIIEGPPGCGKTLLAQHICESKGRDISAYISASVPLNNRVQACGKATVFHAADSEGIVRLLGGELKDKLHIVIDDNHSFIYDENVIQKICALIAGDHRKRLYVFQDSVFQNYKELQMRPSFQQLAINYIHPYGSFSSNSLTNIWRNTRAVGPFIEAQVTDQLLESNDIKCLSEEKGDDVVITHLQNLRADDGSNGLLIYIRKIIANQTNTHTKPYSPQDIAILVDHKDPDIAMKEVNMFKKVFKTFWPESNVQSAETFPVNGIIVDLLDNFLGLEARWVIFILNKEPRFQGKDDQSVRASVRYRIAVASRGKDRVDFVQEENLNERVAREMKCDKCPSKFIQVKEDSSTHIVERPDIGNSETEPSLPRNETGNLSEPGSEQTSTFEYCIDLGSDNLSRVSSVNHVKRPDIGNSETEPSLARNETRNQSEPGSEQASTIESCIDLGGSDNLSRVSSVNPVKKRARCSRYCVIM